jgi:hypothetical protein
MVQENALINTGNATAHRLHRLMQWEPIDNAGGDNALDVTKDHLLAFLCAYRLLDVLSLYDAHFPLRSSFTIRKNLRLPTLTGKKVCSSS